MSAWTATPVPVAPKPHDQFVVSHGKSGALGVFTAPEPMLLRRGQSVVVQTARGIEIGAVLCPATLRQARILGAASAGPLLRNLTLDDEIQRDKLRAIEQRVFETSRAWAECEKLAMEILDVDLSFDGAQAVIQFIGNDEGTDKLALALEPIFGIAIRLENLAAPLAAEEHEHGGCDKPDCGRTADGGGCSTCSTGGGCSSCGSSKTDISQYFGHLRNKMEASQRIPLA
jgi:cell fate regulator YaaT (PSP1 superfamily)